MNWIKRLFGKKKNTKQCDIRVVGITLTERVVKPEKHILDNKGKRIRVEKPPFN